MTVTRKNSPPTKVSEPDALWSEKMSSMRPSLWLGGRKSRRNAETAVNDSSFWSTIPKMPVASRISGSSVTSVLNAIA